jgi:AcrR family transcriptional regulator
MPASPPPDSATPPRRTTRPRRATAAPDAASSAAPNATPNAASEATPDATPRAPLTPEVWINTATEVLVNQGIDHVRVDLLATQLQVTRGSFYWHFRSREDLLRRVLQTWSEQATVQLTRRLETAHSDPQAQLQDLISLPLRGRAATRAARIELAIRAWARRDEMARRAVDEADASRMGYSAQVFSALGFSPVEARARAFLLYTYQVGCSLMATQASAAQHAERGRFVEQLLQRPLA